MGPTCLTWEGGCLIVCSSWGHISPVLRAPWIPASFRTEPLGCPLASDMETCCRVYKCEMQPLYLFPQTSQSHLIFLGLLCRCGCFGGGCPTESQCSEVSPEHLSPHTIITTAPHLCLRRGMSSSLGLSILSSACLNPQWCLAK